MKLTTKKKNELLDYAIERINEYDGYLNEEHIWTVLDSMRKCFGCIMTKRDCKICPFSIKKTSYNTNCRPLYQLHKSPKEHQSDLIEAVNKWCEKFYPKYKVVRTS